VEIASLIVGMLVFGTVTGKVGRLWGSRGTAAFMLIGGVLLAAASGASLTDQFIRLDVGLAVLSVGVGGEYPLAASSSAERAEAEYLRSEGAS
jgi:MFS family permease